MAAGGCVALNPGFEGSGGGTGGVGSSDTGQKTASDSNASPSGGGAGSAVTTVTEGDSTGGGSSDSDPTDPSGPPPEDTGHSGDSSGGEASSDDSSGGFECTPHAEAVVDDAFLLTCPDNCGDQNYGQRVFGPLRDGEDVGVLLLRIPNPSPSSDLIEVTVHFVAEGEVAMSSFTLSAVAIDSPCPWVEGERDGGLLAPGEGGATFWNCNGDPNAPFGWTDGDGTVWDHVDPAWDSGEYTVEAGDIMAGEIFAVTLFLEREEIGATPDALVIEADVTAVEGLYALSSEHDFEPPFVDVWSCL